MGAFPKIKWVHFQKLSGCISENALDAGGFFRRFKTSIWARFQRQIGTLVGQTGGSLRFRRFKTAIWASLRFRRFKTSIWARFQQQIDILVGQTGGCCDLRNFVPRLCHAFPRLAFVKSPSCARRLKATPPLQRLESPVLIYCDLRNFAPRLRHASPRLALFILTKMNWITLHKCIVHYPIYLLPITKYTTQYIHYQ